MPRESKKKVLSKKHLARVERERRQTRFILISSAVVILLTVGLIGYGALDQRVLQPLRSVAKVNGEKISLKDFQARTRYFRLITVQQIEQIYQSMQMFGNDPQFQQYFMSYMQQYNSQLEPSYMGQSVLDNLINEKLIRQEAKKRNITVSKEEVDQFLQQILGYYPSGTPTPTPTFQAKPTSTLNATQYALVSPTPTATATVITPTATLTSTAHLTPSVSGTPTSTLATQTTGTPIATVTPSVTATPVVTGTVGPTATLAPTLSPTPYTLEQYQKNYKNEIDAFQSQIQFSEAEYRNLIETELLRRKLEQAVVGDIPAEQDFVWSREIQVADEATAKTVLDRIKKGEDFGKVASEVSTDTATKSNNGDLGWILQYNMKKSYGADFAKAAFETLSIGQISQPIKGTNGWYLVQVLGHEKRTLSPAEIEQLRQTMFQDWLTQDRTDSKVETFDLWKDNIPTTPDISPEIRQTLSAPTQQ